MNRLTRLGHDEVLITLLQKGSGKRPHGKLMAQDVLGRSRGKETFSKGVLFFRSKGWKREFAFYSLKLIMIPVSGFCGRSSVSGTGLYYMQT